MSSPSLVVLEFFSLDVLDFGRVFIVMGQIAFSLCIESHHRYMQDVSVNNLQTTVFLVMVTKDLQGGFGHRRLASS